MQLTEISWYANGISNEERKEKVFDNKKDREWQNYQTFKFLLSLLKERSSFSSRTDERDGLKPTHSDFIFAIYKKNLNGIKQNWQKISWQHLNENNNA